jgi:transcription elongation factor GreA
VSDINEPTWLSPSAFQKLQDELEQLTSAGRREMEERLAEARAHGDISENADYEAAKEEQGLMEARIRKIRHLLRTAEVREAGNGDTVEVGSVVAVRDDDGAETEFFVAPPENKVPGYLLASPSSPLGRALLGARPGETVAYEAPAGTFTFEVIAIRPFDG